MPPNCLIIASLYKLYNFILFLIYSNLILFFCYLRVFFINFFIFYYTVVL